VSLKVYNIMGQLVETLINNEVRSAGEYTLKVNMNRHASGVYIYTLTQGSMQITKKMMLLK
ncbi:MAG TPA: T9SS type A sorting domain-containing protein, partial [Ignavibacteriales bacterium]|nr:T9SS type A sorting domain-containing protein [Ignavibacteriales bacterium]